MLWFICFLSHKFPHMKTRQNTCGKKKCSSAYIYGNFQWADKFAQTFVIFTPRIFLCSPNLTSIYSWCEILRSRIKSNSFVEIDRFTNYLQKVMPERISNIRMFFFFFFFKIGTTLAFRYSVKMNRQDKRHLPKMHTLVVTMNWNQFRNIFRIRYRIYCQRFELSH